MDKILRKVGFLELGEPDAVHDTTD